MPDAITLSPEPADSGAAPGVGTTPARHLVRSHATRAIHLLLLLAVVHQLINSQFIQEPLPGEDPSSLFLIHEYVGLASLALVFAFWVWTVVRRGETRFERLVPWFSLAAIRDVWLDLRTQAGRLARGRAPDDEDGALASATHGLGLLVVSVMAATGGVYFFTEGGTTGDLALSAHRLFANAMWAYLVAHAGVAVLHALLGSDILSRMFWLGGRRGPASRRHDPAGV